MPVSVRLPRHVKQKLAEYCVSHKISKSQAIKQALERLLAAKARNPSPYELGKDFFEQHRGTPATEDKARNTNRLLREHFRGRRK
jgi:Arc/MetJ-type ribon-helix-helix transcriptional regulator